MSEREALLARTENCDYDCHEESYTDISEDDIPERCKPVFSPKWSIIISCATWGFLSGVERAIILPTLWLYFTNKFGSEAAQTYYGITLSAFNLSVFLFAPLYGYLACKGFRTKFLLVISNQMEIIGNIIYFVASEPWHVLLGRFISGIGSGSEVPLYADVVRITNSKERTFFIIILLLTRQIGLIIGPAATLILHPVQFMIGNIKLNIYNSPGFLMAILWATQTVLVLLVYPEIAKDGRIIDVSYLNMRLDERIVKKVFNRKADINIIQEEDEGYETLGRKFDRIIVKCKVYSNYVTLTILMIVFVSYFCLMGLEAVIPPITIRYFNWTEVHNSYLYLIAGVMVIVIFGILQKVSQYVKDRLIYLFGLILLVIGYIWMSVTLAFIDSHRNILFISLMSVALTFHVFGLSLVVACGESLFTKALPSSEMNLAQSVLRTVINFSLLIGPYVAGMLQFYSYFVFVIMLIMASTSLLLVLARYDEFDIK